MSLIPVILAGGAGTRLWPLSRRQLPKQFINLVGDGTMLQQTIARLNGLNFEKVLVICSEDHRFLVADQLDEIDVSATIILEPVGRNTAPAITVAALLAEPDDTLLVLPADHLIANSEIFCEVVGKALELAMSDLLVTMGVTPSAANTGYGYIKAGSSLSNLGYEVDYFREKPDLETAEAFIKEGCYYWNSGIFVFSARSFLNEIALYKNEVLDACRSAVESKENDKGFLRIKENAYLSCPDISIDYAVLEKTKKAVLVELDAGWSDVGSWDALFELLDKDEYGNSLPSRTTAINTSNSMIHSENDRLICVVGIRDLVVVDTPDALLIAASSDLSKMKSLVSKLKECETPELELHQKVHRPWGNYEAVDNGDRHQVKRIFVKPGERLSLQKHQYRAEHWVVVTGIAEVTKGDEVLELTENQSIYIPQGVVHSLHNPGENPLEIIEIQTGTYFGEDDIVRLEDSYGRA